ncbi:MAG: class I SAM-dependent methyltransferase [Chthoniobacterales bacterium]
MKLAHKLRKLAHPAAIVSAKRAVRRAIRPLPVNRFMAQIDRGELERLKQTYGVPGTTQWPKYVEAERFLRMNIRRVQDIGLDRLPPQRILDLGSGAGYFLFVNKVLGHTGVGLDVGNVPLYREMFQLFGLRRVIHRIEKFKPLPDTGAQYDWITAFSISFDSPARHGPWGIAEWDFFLQDARRHLCPGGRIYLDLNPRDDGTFYSDDLREFFVTQGAVIDRRSKLLFPPKL